MGEAQEVTAVIVCAYCRKRVVYPVYKVSGRTFCTQCFRDFLFKSGHITERQAAGIAPMDMPIESYDDRNLQKVVENAMKELRGWVG